MKTLNYQHIVREAILIYPPLCALFMLHHVLALIVGYDVCFHDWIVDCSLVSFIMQWILSHAFRFCIWHRLCIIYTFSVSFCVNYERSIGFGIYRDPLRWVVLLVGSVVLIMFIIKCLRRHHEEEPFDIFQ